MVNNPFLLPLPAICDVSGGRTSAYMLRRVLDAHYGQPKDLHCIFCNTGKERLETLDFVATIQREWKVAITWLEYRYQNSKHAFEIVDYATASRAGEPFEQIIQQRNDHRKKTGKPPILPNPVTRFCTGELKIRTKKRYMASLGFTNHQNEYHHAIGLRADEEKRVYRLLKQCSASRETGIPLCPLYTAGVTEQDIMRFWSQHSFDLKLRSYEGNCDLCFLKARHKIDALQQERNQDFAWWAQQEEKYGATFRKDRPSYRQLMSLPVLPFQNTCEEEDDFCHCTD